MYFAAIDYKKAQNDKEENKRKEYGNRLKVATGERIFVTKDYKYNKDYRGRHTDGGYYVYTYNIKLVESPDGKNDVLVPVSEHNKTKYNNETSTYDVIETTYSIAGLMNLNPEQLKGIIAILKTTV